MAASPPVSCAGSPKPSSSRSCFRCRDKSFSPPRRRERREELDLVFRARIQPGIAMGIVERVETLLRDYEGDPCCDDHITKQLGLESRKQAQRAIYSVVAKNNDFRRSRRSKW